MTGKLDWWRLPAKLWMTLEQIGVTATTLVGHAGLSDELHQDSRTLISTRDGFRLWRSVEHLAADPIVALRMLQSANEHGRDATFLAAYHAATYRDALNNMARFKNYYTPVQIAFRESAGLAYATRFWPTTHDEEPDISVDYSFAEFVGIGRLGTGQHLSPVRIEFRRRGPAIAFYEDYFGCRIRYGAPADLLVLKSADLDRPFLSSDPDLLNVITLGLHATMNTRRAHRSITQQVASEIRHRLGHDTTDIEGIAQALGLSRRTLQRRIEEEGSSFRELISAGKREVAIELLAGKQLKIKEVAAKVGFQDTASFTRAFYQWEGTTPASWRDLRSSAQRPPKQR